jgi:hypothetical protein
MKNLHQAFFFALLILIITQLICCSNDASSIRKLKLFSGYTPLIILSVDNSQQLLPFTINKKQLITEDFNRCAKLFSQENQLSFQFIENKLKIDTYLMTEVTVEKVKEGKFIFYFLMKNMNGKSISCEEVVDFSDNL